MLSPALLQVSIDKDKYQRRCSAYVTSEPGSPRRRRSKTNGSDQIEEEDSLMVPTRSMSDYRRPSLLLIDDTFIPQVRRHSSSTSFERKKSKEITPHQYTQDPTLAWEMLKEKRPVKRVIQMKLDAPIKQDHVRFVCLGCTHGLKLDPSQIPPGDVLIISGDFTTCGLPKEVFAFNKSLAHLKHPYKVIIAGNHECTFDETFLKSNTREMEAKEIALKQALQSALSSAKLTTPKPLLTNAIYLEDSVIELFGITIYGTPWQPRCDNWAFNLPRGQALLDKWNQIPPGVDVLISHTPPLGHGDLMKDGRRMGCVELLNTVTKRVKPKYHVFSHIHEGYGCTSDGYTKFINCAVCDENLECKNDPVIFDIPVHAHTKQYYLQNVKKMMKRFNKQK